MLKGFLSAFFFISFLSFPSCSLVPEKVQVAYQPIVQTSSIGELSGKNIEIRVVDNRRDGKQVSYKKGDRGQELSSIKLKGSLEEEISKAVSLELSPCGCAFARGGLILEIEIQKLDFFRN